MSKTPKEIEEKIIELYNKGLSGLKICSELNLKHNSIVYKILKKNGIQSRHESYVRTDEHKSKARETLERNKSKFSLEEQRMHSIKGGKERGKQLKLDPEHQSKSGRKGGEKTIQLHPEQSINNWSKNNLELQSRISSETVRRTHQNDPTLASRMGKSTYQKHPELASKIAKKTHQKYPNLASRMGKSTHLRHPEQASMMGKISYQKHPGDNLRKAELFFEKHPDFRSNVAKKTHQKMKENDPEGYSKKQTDAMLAGSKGKTKPEEIMGDILPNDFVYNQHFICGAPDFRSESRKIIIQVDGPRHYKTMGKFYDKEKVIKTQEKDKRQEIRWAEEGYKVYRFTDIEINKEKDKVAERVKKILSI